MFNRHDICDAYYVFATNYHRGQWSSEYAIFGRLDDIKYHPGLSAQKGVLNDNAVEVLDRLIQKYGFENCPKD